MAMSLIDKPQKPVLLDSCGGNAGGVSVSVVQSVLLVVGVAFALALTVAWCAFLTFEVFSFVVSLF
jgi:hypothetical protein